MNAMCLLKSSQNTVSIRPIHFLITLFCSCDGNYEA